MLQDLQLHCAEDLMSTFHRVCVSQGRRGVLGEMMGWIRQGEGRPNQGPPHLSLLWGCSPKTASEG